MELALQEFENQVKTQLKGKITACSCCRAKTAKNKPCTAKGIFSGFCGKHKSQSSNEKYFIREVDTNIVYHVGHLPGEYSETCPRCNLNT
tara:strand:+ start:4128 stop:4397 length:270 start_codon:yes stop_codon:yes gene_type:complete